MFFTSKASKTSAEMLLEHIDGLYRYAVVLSGSCGDAEELVLETYVRALPAIGRRLRKGSNIKKWLFIILRNIWLNQLRRPRVVLQMAETDIDEYLANTPTMTVPDADSLPLSKIGQEYVRRAIQTLPTNAREIILLREFEGLSYQEIATVLDCPMETIMSRLARARSTLRIQLSPWIEKLRCTGKEEERMPHSPA